MSTFPKLKTGAVAQHPAQRILSCATEVHRFVDGKRQKYRKARAMKRWVIRLDLLDDTERARVEEFVASMQGRFGSFCFEDPWDASVHPDCSLEKDELIMELHGEAKAVLVLVVKENKA